MLAQTLGSIDLIRICNQVTNVLQEENCWQVALNSLHAGYFSCLYCQQLIYFKFTFSQTQFSREHYQSVIRFESRSDRMSVQVWVQTICKGYQQITKVTVSKESVKVL